MIGFMIFIINPHMIMTDDDNDNYGTYDNYFR